MTINILVKNCLNHLTLSSFQSDKVELRMSTIFLVRATIGGMPEATSKLQRFLSRLLCVLVLVSSVDRVPDPPSIKPHHDVAIYFGLNSHHLPVANHDHGSDLVSFDRSGHARSFELGRLSDEKLLPRTAIYLDQASDSSPPHRAP